MSASGASLKPGDGRVASCQGLPKAVVGGQIARTRSGRLLRLRRIVSPITRSARAWFASALSVECCRRPDGAARPPQCHPVTSGGDHPPIVSSTASSAPYRVSGTHRVRRHNRRPSGSWSWAPSASRSLWALRRLAGVRGSGSWCFRRSRAERARLGAIIWSISRSRSRRAASGRSTCTGTWCSATR